LSVKRFTDNEMKDLLPTAEAYSVAILKAGPKYRSPEAAQIIWEHGRRNFGLRDQGVLSVVLPVTDESDVCGIGVFNCSVEQAKKIMDGDPGVAAGVFVYDVHPCRGFPGDHLP
jgi:hypothetical protein